MTWFHAARARLRLLAPRAAESRIDHEIRFHIEMETERLVREQQLTATKLAVAPSRPSAGRSSIVRRSVTDAARRGSADCRST